MSIVQLEDVHKRFGALEVLRGVSLAVPRGAVVVLIGRSGSGKSTLLRCVNGLEAVDSGVIRVDGMPVTTDEPSLRQLRQRVGFVFQSFNLFPHLTAERNVSVGLTVVKRMPPAEAAAVAAHALEKVGLADKRDAYPDQLSGGQQQRVCIARAMINEPLILLADEPTGALDSKTGQQILELFDKLVEVGKTIILVTHDPSVAHRCQRVIRLHDGIVQSDERNARHPVSAEGGQLSVDPGT